MDDQSISASPGGMGDTMPGRTDKPSSGNRGACTGDAYGVGKGADVVGAFMASAVDEEGGGSRHAAEVGGVDVLGHPSFVGVGTQVVLEAVRVQAQLLGVAKQIVAAQRVLVHQHQVVHSPEGPLCGGSLGGLGSQLCVGVDVGKRKMAPDVAHVAGAGEQ